MSHHDGYDQSPAGATWPPASAGAGASPAPAGAAAPPAGAGAQPAGAWPTAPRPATSAWPPPPAGYGAGPHAPSGATWAPSAAAWPASQSTGPHTPPPPGARRPRRGGAIALWAAVIGAVVGAGVGVGVTKASGSSGATTTVREVVLPGNQVAQLTDIPAILAKVEPGVVTVTTNLGAGTGMVITPSGEVVTNYHVIGGASRIRVTIFGQKVSRTAVVTGFDQGNDVALLQIQGVANLPTVSFGDSQTLVPGDDVVAVGNALALPGGPTVTSGIVSAVGRTIPGVTTGNGEAVPPDLIQTDAAINPGNSGGPLVNADGKVVGMNTLVITGANATQSAQNLGFAIPVATIAKLIPALAGGAKVKPAYLGVGVDDNSAQFAKQYGLAVTTGAIVAQVVPGGPAARAGVKPFDVITDFGGQPVQDAASLVATIDTHKPGDTVPFTVVRGHRTVHLVVTLGSKPVTTS